MSKELIISSNRFEKKIAIVENGVLTEFYIERSNENQGIAGNIYKGRVMKVLPGMQSAFVDIGLDRDAFLYVSDFVDEEDELGKEEDEGAVKPARRQEPRPPQAPREQRPAQERRPITAAAPEVLQASSEEKPAGEIAGVVAVESAEAAAEISAGEKIEEEAAAPPARGRVRRAAADQRGPRRGRGRRGKPDAEAPNENGEALVVGQVQIDQSPAEPLERITDEDVEAETGELLKEVLIHQKLERRLHEAEFSVPETQPIEIEPSPTVTVGSLKATLEVEPGLERVVDVDDQPESHDAEAESEPAPESNSKTASEEQPTVNSDLLIEPESARSAEEPSADAADLPDSEASVRVPSRRQNFSRRPSRRGGRKYPPRGHSQTNAAATPATATAPAVEAAHPSLPTITDLLREGQEILVQIAKEPIASKGARITSHIALPGRYCVYMPTVDHIGVSRKIPSDDERLRLKRLMIQVRKDESCPGGFIVRTAGANRSEEDLRQDAKYLIRTWNDVRKNAEKAKAPAIVHRDLDLVQRLLRDQLSDDFSVIRVDNEAEYTNIVEFVNRIQPKLVRRVKLHTKDTPIFEQYAVQEEIDKALKPRVWLKSGGYIVINQTEALVAIDVNTGKFVGKSNRLEDTIVKTNMDAVKEIVRQIRLRDLGGIIVLDFIDMEERKNRQKVMQLLEEEIKSDRSPSKILQFNEFGLVAITRKRVKQSLERTLCTPCPNCTGSGLVKSPQTVCYEIFSEARKIAKDVSPSSDVTLRVHPEVAKLFRTEEKRVLEEIEGHLGCPVALRSDPQTHIEQFDFAVL